MILQNEIKFHNQLGNDEIVTKWRYFKGLVEIGNWIEIDKILSEKEEIELSKLKIKKSKLSPKSENNISKCLILPIFFKK